VQIEIGNELAAAGPSSRRLRLELAATAGEVDEVQRLRHQVFVEELGASPEGDDGERDQDAFDAHCDHLVVRDGDTGQAVGTYRLLPGSRAARLGGFYADGEFDLARLQHLRERAVELGRACIHPDYRTGAVIMLLWSGIARYMRQHGQQTLIGCASIGMADGGANALAVYRSLAARHLAPAEYRVFPRYPLPLELLHEAATPSIPPLLKGYLRVGAWIAGEPAWDPDFNTADLLVLLPLARIEARYARHYLAEKQAA
jgi:putative hemolysin